LRPVLIRVKRNSLTEFNAVIRLELEQISHVNDLIERTRVFFHSPQ